MPGPTGITTSGNLPLINFPQPQVLNQPGSVGNVGGVRPGGVQPNAVPQSYAPQEQPLQEPLRAADVVGQLDVLLLKAVKGSSGQVTAGELEDAARSAGLSKKDVAELKNLANSAQASLAKLDSFTGRDLAAAMEKNAGGVEWKEGNEAAQALTAAQKAQEALSDAIMNVLGKAKDGDTQAVLEDLMFKCDRRIAEIETLVLQMTEIVEKGGDNAIKDAAALAKGGTISSFTSANALEKFDRGKLLTSLKAELKPITDRLDEYARLPYADLKKADIDKCSADLDAIMKRLFAVKDASVLKEDADGNVDLAGTFITDRSFLSEATKLLDGVRGRINSLQREVVRSAMSSMVEKGVPYINEKIFSPELVGELGRLISPNRANGQGLQKVMTGVYNFRNAARAYVASPTEANAKALKNAARVLKDPIWTVTDILDPKIFKNAEIMGGASPEFTAAFARFKKKVAADGEYLKQIKGVFDHIYDNLDIVVSQLQKLAGQLNAPPGDKYLVSIAVLDAFKGVTSNSTLIEARVHGYGDGDINPDLDDRNVEKSKTLGSGNFNTVTLVRFKDGSERVFKPELAGRLAAPSSPLNTNMDANQQFTRINTAVQTTADVLGLGDIMVKTTAGTHKGQFGMFMEKAPGITGKKFVMSAKDEREVGPGNLGIKSIVKLNDADFGKVVGRIMRQENRMNWFDLLTGQGDRHSDNYMLEVKESDFSVNLKAIDNDASYGIVRQGLYKFRLPKDSTLKEAFEETLANIKKSAVRTTDGTRLVEKILKDPGVIKMADGSYEIDLSKSKDPRLLGGILGFIGPKNAVPPAEIDKELYDKLMTLAEGGEKRGEYLASLENKLGKGSEQYKCAVLRLDEAIAHAKKLNEQGKVYTAEQWENHDVQRKIAEPNLTTHGTKLDLNDLDKNEMAKNINKKGKFMNYTNGFFRDFYQALQFPKNEYGQKYHEGWFDKLG